MKRIIALFTGLIAVVATASIAGAAPSAHSADLPVLQLALDGKSIQVSGSMVSGAVTVSSTTTKEQQSAPTLLRLDPGVTFQQAFAQVGAHHGDPNALIGYASITYSTQAGAGTSTGQTTLQPGNYVAIDTIANNPAKWPHTSFTVTKSASEASLPKPSASVKMIDFAFTGSKTLHEGQLVRFENDGYLTHMAVAVKVASMKDARAVTKLLLAGKDNQAQKLARGFASFVGSASPGLLEQQRITVAPGIYVLACFMNTEDGREHTRLGMERTIKIVK